MIYTECQPHITLLPYIETYWYTKGYLSEIKSEKILPDGCVDIIFSFEDSSTDDSLVPLLPNIVGTMTTYSEIYLQGYVSMLGIRFRPAGITAFTRVPIYSFTDQHIDLTLIDSLFDSNFYLSLPEHKSIAEKIKHVDFYLMQKIKDLFTLDKQIVYAVDLMRSTNGQLSLTDIAQKSCLSLRHFERKFKMTVGISPKSFNNIEKFKFTLGFLKNNQSLDLLSVAIECGYYDHSHLIKELKKMSGESPSSFRND